MSLSPLWGVPGGCSLAGGYALFWSPVYEPPDLCRYQPHLSEAIEDSPELWPRHKAHGSIRVPEGQPTAGFWLYVQVGISPCRPPSQSFLELLIRGLEECPAAIADHPIARAGGIAGIAQVEPDDAHAAAVCGGEQPAHRNPAASALRPETTRVEALDPAAVWSKLEKGASYPGLEITSCHAGDSRAAARTDKRRLPIKC